MGRHLIDHNRNRGAGRLSRFLSIARQAQEDGVRPAFAALGERGRVRSPGSRIRAFLRIERGYTA